MTVALVIGAGPSGLMAATMLAKAGQDVVVAEAMPSIGRKFLMAGKSGLNLTKDEPLDTLLTQYSARPNLLKAITEFGPDAVKEFAQSLNQPTFTGSSGRLFPKAMKASPLLRAWRDQLGDLGVKFLTKHRWDGQLTAPVWTFQTPDGKASIDAKVAVLALGGGSWSRLGSDGLWSDQLAAQNVAIKPFQPSNCGFLVPWSDHMAPHLGSPIKSCTIKVKGSEFRGEFVITKRGVEGGAIYLAARALRESSEMHVDLFPDLSVDQIEKRLSKPRGKASFTNHLRKSLGLKDARLALAMECLRPLPASLAEISKALKSLPIQTSGAFPIDEAISTSGGVFDGGVDANFMLTSHPGVFCAGEMLDWDAPTGGYLLTACFATGKKAGQAAADYITSDAL